ncbi:alpha/beta hydrolase [bacterium]|nr:MAG: alpha/beta hydrolase [bacterium]
MKKKALLVVLCAAAAAGQPQERGARWEPPAELRQVPIWPGAAPDSPAGPDRESFSSGEKDKPIAGKPVGWITEVSQPTMTVYPAKGKNTGAAVIVFPGGGFQGLAIDLEGTEVCDWLAPKGVTCVVLKYRVPNTEHHWDKKLRRYDEPKVPLALQDAQRAISLVRSRGAEWGIDPKKLGVLGFSAGGFLVARTSTEFERRAYAPVDAADKESCRPDFAVPVYPGHLWIDGRLNPKVRIPAGTPPTFLLMAEDDRVDHVEQALVYYEGLKKAKVPVEMHLYAAGGHAFGLRPTKDPITRWPALVEAWLRTIGMVSD